MTILRDRRKTDFRYADNFIILLYVMRNPKVDYISHSLCTLDLTLTSDLPLREKTVFFITLYRFLARARLLYIHMLH